MKAREDRDMYRPPVVAPVTPWARYIDSEMRAKGLSQTQAFERSREALGLGERSRTGFRPYLADREPDEREAAALASVWGPLPDAFKAAPASPAAVEAVGLSDALMALAESNREMARALAAFSEERAAWMKEIAELREAVAGLSAGSAPRRPAPEPAFGEIEREIEGLDAQGRPPSTSRPPRSDPRGGGPRS
jgi:hypothetical protein